MKRAIPVMIALLLASLSCFAAKKASAKVQIAAPTEDRAIKYHSGGLVGAIEGSKTTDVVFILNAVINGDHARLKCDENHHGCTALGPGEYDAEIEIDSVWIITGMPVTHKVVRDYWKISGSW